MKKLIYIILISVFFVSCSAQNDYEIIHNKILNFDKCSYEMEYKVISNKNENTYKIRVSVNNKEYQVEFLEPENISRILTNYKENSVEQKNTKIHDNLNLVNEGTIDDNLMLLSNFKEVYEENSENEIVKMSNEKYKALITIQNGNYYFRKQEIIFDSKTKEPIEMNVYSEDGKKTVFAVLKIICNN